jgi:proteic killer suppression protein
VIKTFADKATAELFFKDKIVSKKIPPEIKTRALRKLTLIDSAVSIEDLKVPPSNRLHKLEGDRNGQYSISINMQWRICFCFIDSDANDVEICDYH